MTSNIIPTLRYLWLTLKHKTFVFRAGLRTKAPIWRLIIHDWSKFTPAEAPHYGRQFFGAKDDPDGFARCWLHHQNHNPHHHEYWLSRSNHDRATHHAIGPHGALPMPEWAVREMVADWMGASRAYEGVWPKNWATWRWLQASLRQKVLPSVHPLTRQQILLVLTEVLGEAPASVVVWREWDSEPAAPAV